MPVPVCVPGWYCLSTVHISHLSFCCNDCCVKSHCVLCVRWMYIVPALIFVSCVLCVQWMYIVPALIFVVCAVCSVDVHRSSSDIRHDVSESQSERSGSRCCRIMTDFNLWHDTSWGIRRTASLFILQCSNSSPTLPVELLFHTRFV